MYISYSRFNILFVVNYIFRWKKYYSCVRIQSALDKNGGCKIKGQNDGGSKTFRYRFADYVLPARHFRDNFIARLRETARWSDLNVAFIPSLQWSTARWANGARGPYAITDAEVALKGAAEWSRSRKRTAGSIVRVWTRSGRAAASRHATPGFARSRTLKVSADRSQTGGMSHILF